MTLKQIKKGIVTRIKLGLTGTNYSSTEIISRDIEEGIKRPAIFIAFDNINKSVINASIFNRKFTARIYYFPKDKNKNSLELLDVSDILSNIFLLPFDVSDGFFIDSEEIEIEFVDGTLQISFDVETYEEIAITDNSELMEEIEINEVIE